ncbi:MAG: hypothetical protein KIT36_20595 [Alphaproteobacteria bacterium]|nr:hypothetical protein [Alphaproteobacteria bacterium]
MRCSPYRRRSFLQLAGLCAAGWAVGPAVAQSAPIQSQDTNFAGIVAELTQCKRADGVLTIRVRLRNASNKDAHVDLIRARNYDAYYVTAANKKYFILRDSEKAPLTPAADGFGNLSPLVRKGGIYTWWAKYPAPPPDVTKVNIITPFAPPFEDVPISG